MNESPSTSEAVPAKIDAPRGAPRPATRLSHRCAVELVLARMREDAAAPLRLDEMAATARVSRFHFNHLFRQVTGATPRQFQTALRLQAAARLLLGGDRSVTDICFDVGYESLGSFVTRFTATFGLAPQRLRRLAPSLARPLGELLGGLSARRFFEPAGGPPGPRGDLDAGSFAGLIFVGLFRQRIAAAAPLSCTLLARAGTYLLPPPPEGRYYAMAVGLAPERPAIDLLFGDDLPRGATGSPWAYRRGGADLPPLRLRPPEPIDPPIQLGLPRLFRLAGGAT